MVPKCHSLMDVQYNTNKIAYNSIKRGFQLIHTTLVDIHSETSVKFFLKFHKKLHNWPRS